MRAACGAHDRFEFAQVRGTASPSTRRAMPSLRTVKSARCAFSSCESWRPARSATAACPRAPARSLAHASSATTAIVLSKTASMPDSNSSGTSTTAAAAAGRGARAPPATRRRARRPAATARPRATRAPRRRRRRARRPRAVDRAVRRHLGPEPLDERVAQLVGAEQLVHDGVGRQRGRAELAQRRSASDLPAPRPPVSPTNGAMRYSLGLARRRLVAAPRPAAPRARRRRLGSGSAGGLGRSARRPPRLGSRGLLGLGASAGASASARRRRPPRRRRGLLGGSAALASTRGAQVLGAAHLRAGEDVLGQAEVAARRRSPRSRPAAAAPAAAADSMCGSCSARRA